MEQLAAAAAIALTAALIHQVVSAWSYAHSPAPDPQTVPACRRGFHHGRPVQLDEHGRPVMYTD